MAVDVARDGELAEPRVPAPAGVRTVLGFRRLSASAYAIVRRAVEEDPGFRARVADAATEAGPTGVGRAGWLWLHRPEGWVEDPAWRAEGADLDAGGPGRAQLRRERDGAQAAADRYRRAAEEAEGARRRAVERADASSAATEQARAEAVALRSRLTELEGERNRAVRSLKDLERDLTAARRDLKVARAAARQAEAELLDARGSAPSRPGPVAEPSGSPPPLVDAAAAQDAVAAARAAAEVLAQALDDATAALDLGGDDPTDGRAGDTGRRGDGGRAVGPGRRGRGSRRGRRTPPPRPPGVLDGTPEGDRHLVSSGDALVLVDGYNLARAAWSGLAPEEERRRTVALLEEVAARSGGPVTVVFDGDDHAVAPVASRHVRVRFSATGQTADDLIADLLGVLDPTTPVVVVSSDRAVADDARLQGAAVLAAGAFLAAAGR